MNHKSCILYECQWASLKHLQDCELGAIMRQVFEYAYYGSEPETPSLGYTFIKTQLDKDLATYEKVCERRRESANKRWSKTDNTESSDNAIASNCIQLHPNECNNNNTNTNNNSNTDLEDKEYKINDNIDNTDYVINEQEKKSNTNVLPKEKPAKPKTPTFDFYGALIGDGVEEQVAQDWMAVRKKNGAIDTETAYKGLKREAKKANMTIAEAVQMAAENSWRGFKAIWVERARLERQKAQGLTPNEAYRQQVAHDMLHPKTEIGKSYNRMFGLPVLNENDEEEEFRPYENRYQIENHYPF